MFVVLEGIGGVGKTLLSRKLFEQINFTYIRESRHCPENLSEGQMDDYFLKKHVEVISQLDLKTGNFLMDRSYLSSFAVIYSKVMIGKLPNQD